MRADSLALVEALMRQTYLLIRSHLSKHFAMRWYADSLALVEALIDADVALRIRVEALCDAVLARICSHWLSTVRRSLGHNNRH